MIRREKEAKQRQAEAVYNFEVSYHECTVERRSSTCSEPLSNEAAKYKEKIGKVVTQACDCCTDGLRRLRKR